MFHQKDNKKDISTDSFPVVNENRILDEISSHAQKIATAVYLVTGLMDIADPLRGRLRAKVLDVMSFIASYANLGDKKTKVSFEESVDATREVMSLMEVGASAGVISRMNGDILIQEMNSLIIAFETYVRTPEMHASSLKSLFSDGLTLALSAPSYKGHGVLDTKDKGHKRTKTASHNKSVSHKKHRATSESGTSDRKETILSLIREKGNVMIKDISKHVPNCSEKTIQRDLIDLVSQGLLEKRGERRWTTYFVSKGI